MSSSKTPERAVYDIKNISLSNFSQPGLKT